MQCEAIRPVIRKFMDDLLDEKDYQAVQTHLTGCARCHAYASSVGTLSYRLHELGQVSPPPDMVSTAMYELRHELKKEVPGPVPDAGAKTAETGASAGAFNARTRTFWLMAAGLCVLSLATLLALGFLLRTPKTRTAAAPAPVSGTVLFSPAPAPAAAPEKHCHLSESSRAELYALAQELGLEFEQPSQKLLILTVPAQKFGEFETRLASLSGVVKEFGDAPASEGPEPVLFSVYFE